MYMYTRVYTGYPRIVAAFFIWEFTDRFRIDSSIIEMALILFELANLENFTLLFNFSRIKL